MKKSVVPAFAACFAAACAVCSCSAPANKDAGVVVVIGAIDSPSELKVSDLGSSITYVPLETNDSSVVGARFGIYPFDDYVAVGFFGNSPGDTRVLAFELPSGKFMNPIGHDGQDPEAITSFVPKHNADGALRAFCGFTDTVYTVTSDGVAPAFVFDLGDKPFRNSDVTEHEVGDDELFLGQMVENPDALVFTAMRGWFADGNTFIGLFDKASGTTRLTDSKKGFVDDLTGFMPFAPIATMPDGT